MLGEWCARVFLACLVSALPVIVLVGLYGSQTLLDVVGATYVVVKVLAGCGVGILEPQ